MVYYCGVNVAICRKVVHITVLCVIPWLEHLSTNNEQDSDAISQSNSSLTKKLVQLIIVEQPLYLTLFIVFLQPIRKYIKLYNIAFHAIDRPKDRP